MVQGYIQGAREGILNGDCRGSDQDRDEGREQQENQDKSRFIPWFGVKLFRNVRVVVNDSIPSLGLPSLLVSADWLIVLTLENEDVKVIVTWFQMSCKGLPFLSNQHEYVKRAGLNHVGRKECVGGGERWRSGWGRTKWDARNICSPSQLQSWVTI